MDLDAYIAAHAEQWRELEQLLDRRTLSASESDRLVELYQAVGTHLSVLRSATPDPSLVLMLSSLLARARRRAGAERSHTWKSSLRWLTHDLPAGLYRIRWWWLATMVVCSLLSLLVGIWVGTHPELHSRIMTDEQIADLVNQDFESYYSSYPASHFAWRIWTNNAWLAIACVGSGVLGFPVLLMLWHNSSWLGMVGALMTVNGRAGLFWGLILPHGLLELTAVFVAGGAGLRLFWSWVEPGPHKRSTAFAHEGRRVVTIAMGLVLVLAVTAVIEAFVTPSGLPTPVRVGIGVLVWVGFMAYALVLGRKRSQQGYDGDLPWHERGDDSITTD